MANKNMWKTSRPEKTWENAVTKILEERGLNWHEAKLRLKIKNVNRLNLNIIKNNTLGYI